MYRRLKCLPGSIPGNQPNPHTFTVCIPVFQSSSHLCPLHRLCAFVYMPLNARFIVVHFMYFYLQVLLVFIMGLCFGCCYGEVTELIHWIHNLKNVLACMCVDAWVGACVCRSGCMCASLCLVNFFSFSQTLRGGLWSSWVLLLRPFLFSCIRLHFAVCWFPAREVPAAWEPARLPCPFWPFCVFWLFLGAWLLIIPRFGWPLWVFWLRTGPSTVGTPAWSQGLLCGGLACCFWALGAKDFGCIAELGTPVVSGLPWPLLLGVFTLFCLRSFFQTRSQNSSTLFSSGWSRRDRKSLYHSLCLAEWPAPPPTPGNPGRMSPSFCAGITWRLRRSRGCIKPCSTAWQW